MWGQRKSSAAAKGGGGDEFRVKMRNPEHALGMPVGDSLIGSFEERVSELGPQRLYTWLRNDCTEEATLSYAEMREQAVAVCVALHRQWGVAEAERAMLIYPPGLELLVAFFGCNYAAVIAVPYYPPVLPTAAMPSAGARSLLADGLDKVRGGPGSATRCSVSPGWPGKLPVTYRHHPPRSRWPRHPRPSPLARRSNG